MTEPINVATSQWPALSLAIAFAFLFASIAGCAVLDMRDRRRSDQKQADLYALIAAEEERWRPVFWSGCHEYQQHEDGRRRALRLLPGEDVLCVDWLGISDRVTK